jgi:O-antigen/teichoic acid export membrane protein
MFYRYSFMALLPFALMILAFAETMISMIFTSEYAPAANALRFLIVGSLFYLIAQNNFSVLSGIGRPLTVAKITIFGAILNIILNVVLIPVFGISGAAMATSTSYVIMAFASILAVRKRIQLRFPVKHWIKTSVISLFMLGIIFWLNGLVHAGLYVKIALILAIASAFYVAASYALGQISIGEIKDIFGSVIKK